MVGIVVEGPRQKVDEQPGLGRQEAQFAFHGVTPDKNIASHCQDGKGSAHAYFTLRLLGFPRVRSDDRSWAEGGRRAGPAEDRAGLGRLSVRSR